MPNHAQPQNEKIAAARREYLEALLATFDSPHGRIVLRALHTSAGTRKPAYSPGGNPNDALWRDGRKSLVLEIEEHLEAARIEHGSKPTEGKPTVRSRARRTKPADPG